MKTILSLISVITLTFATAPLSAHCGTCATDRTHAKAVSDCSSGAVMTKAGSDCSSGAVLTKASGDACCPSGATYAANEATPKIFVVKMHTDQCNTCVSLNPSYASLQDEFGKSSVKFVKFDYTNDKTRAKSAKLAEKYNLSKIYDNKQLAVILIVNAETGEVIETLKKKHTPEQMAQVIQGALSNENLS